MNIFVDPYQIRRAIRDGFRTTLNVGGELAISAGTLSSLRSDVTFSNSNGVSFGLDTNGVVTASVGAAGAGLTNIKISAGTQSNLRSDVTFNNGNGVTFGLNAGVVTASVQTDYQSTGAYLTTAQPPGAYLTTAMQSDASSAFAGTGFTTATTAGSNLVGTQGTNGLSLGVPKWLTTAAGGGGMSFLKVSAGTQTNALTDVYFLNTNGVTFGLNNSTLSASVQTNYQSPGAYLTTAQPAGTYAGTGFTTATTAGTNVVGTLSTNGLSLGVPAYLTTSPSGGISAVKISAGTLSSNVSAITFSNGSGVTFGFDGSNITATVATNYQSPGAYLTTAQPPGAYLTTAALSQDSSKYAGTGFTSTTTAGTNIVATLNTSGLSMGVPAFLTVAGGAFTPRLDQVLDPNTDKVFSMGGNMLQLQWGTGGSFSTNATREGMFELDVQGNVTAEADVVHAHQHGGAPTKLDILHVEGDGANVTGLRLQMSASIAAEINQPIKFTTEDTGYNIGSVPMILGTGMSNSVANLNANFVQGRASSQLAGLGFTSATTAGTAVVATLSTNGLSMGVPAYLTTAAGTGIVSDRAGTNTSVVTTAGTDLSFAVNTSGVTIAYPKWLTAAAGGGGVAISNSQTLFSTGTVAFSAATGGAMTIASSAGGQSLIFSVPQTSSLVGSGMISIGTAGSTVNISAPNTSSLMGAGVMTVSTNGSTISILAPATSSLAGSGGVSISTTGSTIAIYGVGAGTGTSTATITGQNITLSADSGGVTLGYPLFTTTQGAAVLSFFQNMPHFPVNTTTFSASGSVLQVVPFVLPQAVSGGFMRFAASLSFTNTTLTGTSVNTSFTVNRSHTVALAIMTQMTGVSSGSIGYSTSTFGSFVFQTAFTAGATGSNFTVSMNATFPQLGSYVNNFQSIVATTLAGGWSVPAGVVASLSSIRWIDIPFAMSLSPGNYWLVMGGSSNSAANAATSFGTAGFSPISFYGQSQSALTPALIGSATASSVQMAPGLGSWSTNAALMSTSSIQVGQVSIQAGQIVPYFQIIRNA